MRTLSLGLSTVLFLVASILPAEVVIKRYDGPLPAQDFSSRLPQGDLPPAISTLGSFDKVENPTDFYILPAFKIDTNDPAGETTAIAIRNEDDAVNTATIEFFEANSVSEPITIMNALFPKEVWTLNLRNETGAIPADFGGFIRGWARVQGSSGPISADFFQIDSGQDFATGGRPIDISGGEFCENATLRFLVGGAFTGGTLITFMLDLPLGGDPDTDPPSITGTVYREDGGVAGTFQIFTDNFSLEVDASNLIDDENFGSMDFTFENAFGGGFAMATFKADNRYSVSIKSVCLDSLSP
jgi:hypothetical protein